MCSDTCVLSIVQDGYRLELNAVPPLSMGFRTYDNQFPEFESQLTELLQNRTVIARVLGKMWVECTRAVVVAPYWPREAWFLEYMRLTTGHFLPFPKVPDFLLVGL